MNILHDKMCKIKYNSNMVSFISVANLLILISGSMLGVFTPQAQDDAVVFRFDVEVPLTIGWAVGGLAVYTSWRPFGLSHELGHLEQEREMGNKYIPVLLATTVIGNGLSLLGVDVDYRDLQFERVATEIGKAEYPHLMTREQYIELYYD